MESNKESFFERYSWLALFVLGLLLTLSTLGILVMGANPPRQFETDTGVAWEPFASDYPSVATLVSLYELLLATGFFGFALFATAIAYTRYRMAEKWAWYAMWIFPIVIALAALLFFSHDQAYVGYFYAGAALIALLGMILPYRRFFPRTP